MAFQKVHLNENTDRWEFLNTETVDNVTALTPSMTDAYIKSRRNSDRFNKQMDSINPGKTFIGASKQPLPEEPENFNDMNQDNLDRPELDESLFESVLSPVVKRDIKNSYKSWDNQNSSKDNEFQDLYADAFRRNAYKQGLRGADAYKDYKNNMNSISQDKSNPNSSFHYDAAAGIEKHDFPYYVTYYEEYPIYEPAEGGYYYAGVQAIESVGCDSLEDAKEQLKEIAEEMGLPYRQGDVFVEENSKYIGQSRYAAVESRKEYLSRVSGRQIYESSAYDSNKTLIDKINYVRSLVKKAKDSCDVDVAWDLVDFLNDSALPDQILDKASNKRLNEASGKGIELWDQIYNEMNCDGVYTKWPNVPNYDRVDIDNLGTDENGGVAVRYANDQEKNWAIKVANGYNLPYSDIRGRIIIKVDEDAVTNDEDLMIQHAIYIMQHASDYDKIKKRLDDGFATGKFDEEEYNILNSYLDKTTDSRSRAEARFLQRQAKKNSSLQ